MATDIVFHSLEDAMVFLIVEIALTKTVVVSFSRNRELNKRVDSCHISDVHSF